MAKRSTTGGRKRSSRGARGTTRTTRSKKPARSRTARTPARKAAGGARERKLIAELRAENRRLRAQLAELRRHAVPAVAGAQAAEIPTLPLKEAGAPAEPSLSF